MGDGNRHPYPAVEVGVVPSEIIPAVAYVVSMAIRLRSCTELTPVASNGSGRSWDAPVTLPVY